MSDHPTSELSTMSGTPHEPKWLLPRPPVSLQEKTKKSGWDKVHTAIHYSITEHSPSSSSSVSVSALASGPGLGLGSGSGSGSASSIPLLNPSRPPYNVLPKGQRNPLFNPFSREQSSTDTTPSSSERQYNLVNTTFAAVQAAGMSNFGRNFRTSRFMHNNGIYATTTAVQQDIYRLERSLAKLLLQLNTRGQHASFTDPPTDFIDSTLSGNSESTMHKLHLLHRYPKSDTSTPPSMSLGDTSTTSKGRTEGSRISAIMNLLLEILQKQKQATRLPMIGEVLAILAIPFDMLSPSSYHMQDCLQSMEIFDYITERFISMTPNENFERVLFCCKLLATEELPLKNRVVSKLKELLAPLAGDSQLLPSTPAVFHALVYTLTNALAAASSPEQGNGLSNEKESFRTSLYELLDSLANGTLIPIAGECWDAYYAATTTSIPPVSIARLCVVEGLCKSLMVGMSHRDGYYSHPIMAHPSKICEWNRDVLIVTKLLERYWSEPQVETQSGYRKVLLMFSKAVTERCLNCPPSDLHSAHSTLYLLVQWVHNKLRGTHLQPYLINKEQDPHHRDLAVHWVSMVLAMVSVLSISPPPVQSYPRSPQHSPQMSLHSSLAEPESLFIAEESYQETPTEQNYDAEAFKRILEGIKVYVVDFWNGGYSEWMLAGVQAMLRDTVDEHTVKIYTHLVFHLDTAMGQTIVIKTLPTLFSVLACTFPPAIPSLCDLLVGLSKHYRSAFYKPIVSCVASNDQTKVTHLLSVITALRKYLSCVQYWMQDTEMINVLLLSDVGQKNTKPRHQESSEQHLLPTGSAEHSQNTKWGTTTLGQCIIAMEFTQAIKELRDKQKDPTRNMEEDEVAKKFLIDLEKRISVFMTAKERLVLVPLPLRVILCNMFLDIRFFCNTTHRPGWLKRVIDWSTQPVATAELFMDSEQLLLPTENREGDTETRNKSTRTSALLRNSFLDDVAMMFEMIRLVYTMTMDQVSKESNTLVSNDTRLSSILSRIESVLQDTEISKDTAASHFIEEDFKANKRQANILAMYPQSHSTVLSLSINPPLITGKETPTEGPATVLARRRLERLPTLHQDPWGAVFTLLVAVFTALSTQEFSRLVQPLWEQFTEDLDPHAFVSVAFLLMQCGEKVPKVVIEIITRDFKSIHTAYRLSALQKHAALNAYKLNILSLDYISITSRKRPFRGDGGAFSTPFVPTDLGNNQYTMDEPHWMSKLKNSSNFPIELKRQIQELGWDDDGQSEENETLKKILAPLVILPSLYMEAEQDNRMNDTSDAMATINRGLFKNDTKQVNIGQIITRRKRASTVKALTLSFLNMVDLLQDTDSGISSALRELLESCTRDDPSLFLRAFLSDLGKYKLDQQSLLLTRLRYLVGMRAKLPPGFVYILFNYLAGMLKWLARENPKDGLRWMTIIHPILAELTLSTNELSSRDLRKNKIEYLLASTGRFWFIHEQPESMFPRRLMHSHSAFTTLDIPWDVFSVAMLRISHIQFLTNFLIRYPREVYAVKKTLHDYEPIPIPGVGIGTHSEAHEMYFPDIELCRHSETRDGMEETKKKSTDKRTCPKRRTSHQHMDITILSTLRSRLWLRFIDVLLNGLNKNYNDRQEFESILKGVNSIILEHKNDFGIMGQALVLYTRVVTRFKRLFVSSRGYTAFIPALFKVFCDVEHLAPIRSAIVFAWCRFYAVHEEAFVFQMLGALVPLILSAYNKSNVLGSWMTDSLFTLMEAMHNPPRLGVTSDILGLQLQVELDDQERFVQELIDTASTPLTMPLSTTLLKPLAKSTSTPALPMAGHDYSERKFKLDSFIRLFLTVIAYDPGSLRAEQFIIMLQYLLPRFWNSSHYKELIADGIAALIDVFGKFSKNTKPIHGIHHINTAHSGASAKNTMAEERDKAQGTSRSESAQHAYGKQWQQNDRLTIKKDFVLLVHAYLKNKGHLSDISHEKMAGIIKTLMRDYSSLREMTCSTDWLRDYLVDALGTMDDTRNYTKSFKKVLHQIYLQYRTQWKNTDAADLYEGLAIILERGQGQAVNMLDIASLIKERFVPFGLTVAMRSDWDKDESGHTRFCNALVRLMIAILENSTQDVLQELEQLPASTVLMSKVIIPICLQYDLRWDGNIASKVRRYRPNPAANWMRLLVYTTKACSQASLLKSKSSGFSLTALTSGIGQTYGEGVNPVDTVEMREALQSTSSPALLFALSFTALKVILVRGAKSLDATKGAWVQVAFFLKRALAFGEVLKTLGTKTASGHATPNPQQSPGISANYWAGMPGSPGVRVSLPSGLHSVCVVYDFALWRFFEFIVCYKNPLILLMREFIHERLRDISSWNARSPLHSPATPKTGGFDMPVDVSGRRSQWRSWSGGLSGKESSHSGMAKSHALTQAQENFTTTDVSTCGLGLHIPTIAKPSSSLPSPTFSMHTFSHRLEVDQEVSAPHPPFSPRSSTGRSMANSPGKPSLLGVSSEKHTLALSHLHTLHAESVTSLVNVQLLMGYKPALPWMADRPEAHLRPWSYRESVSKTVTEWQWLLKLRAELADNMLKQVPPSLPTVASPS
ncbi:hypothetical protein BDF14DRAFT_1791460, partial [Spinellus fusiger]